MKQIRFNPLPKETKDIPPEKSGGSVEAMQEGMNPCDRLSFRLRNQAAPLKLFGGRSCAEAPPGIPPEKSGGSVEATWPREIFDRDRKHSA